MSVPKGLDRQTLLLAFLAESASGSLAMGEAMQQLEKEPSDEQARLQMLCLVHSLKGNARFFGFQELAGRAQMVEEILVTQPLPWPSHVRELLAAVAAAFCTIVPRAVEGGEELLPQERTLFEGLKQAVGSSA